MVQWPLSFKLQQLPEANTPEIIQNWSHELYRGPANQEVTVFYSKTAQDTEEIASKFLDKTVLGFDMEWTFPEVRNPRLSSLPVKI